MKNIKTLKKNYEFKKVFQKGNVYTANNIKAYIFKNKIGENRIGIAISVKADKAVRRNKIKRLIRESYRQNISNIKKGYNIIFLWNKNSEIKNTTFKMVEEDIIKIFKKADMFI